MEFNAMILSDCSVYGIELKRYTLGRTRSDIFTWKYGLPYFTLNH